MLNGLLLRDSAQSCTPRDEIVTSALALAAGSVKLA
jgi:hypothetical protein